MARCTRTENLEVRHKSRIGGNWLGNAQVLCQKCHEATPDYGVPTPPALDFDDITKARALIMAGNRCQCTSSGGCH
jgi:hypothetical protein